jgi:NADPH:quinone reductase-like Zn-dependent oxidoreductase
MRAWVIGSIAGIDHLELQDVGGSRTGGAGDGAALGRDQVLVRTRAVSLNYRDLVVVSGRYQRRLPAGSIPCSDAAGEVVAVGADVSRVRPGDRVTSTFAPVWQTGRLSRAAIHSTIGGGLQEGVLAESFVLPADAVVPMPARWTFEQASTLPCAALTAWHALFEEEPEAAGGTVLTLGTGGVSIFAVQFARAAGVRVIATSSDEQKLSRLTQLGADDVIDYRRTPLWGERAREISGGEGVDRVLEVGGTGTLEQSLRAVRPGGIVCFIGNVAEAAPVNLTPLFMRNIRLQGVTVGSREMFERMNAAIDRWALTPVIDRIFEFDDAPAAFRYLAARRHIGKVVIRVASAA